MESKDNSKEVLAKLNANIPRALAAIGQTAVEITTDYMEHKYGKPIRRTGDLMRSMTFNIRASDKKVDIGSNLEYAPWVHEGTQKMVGHPFLKDAILENKKLYEGAAAEQLRKGIK